MKYITFSFILIALVSCRQKSPIIYDFYEANMIIQVEEHPDSDLFILNERDTLFTRPNHGYYSGIELYICDSNKIYIDNKGTFDDDWSSVKQVTNNYYSIKCLPFIDYKTDFSPIGDDYISIIGLVVERGVPPYSFDIRTKDTPYRTVHPTK